VVRGEIGQTCGELRRGVWAEDVKVAKGDGDDLTGGTFIGREVVFETPPK
jgi:hypothetical protein